MYHIYTGIYVGYVQYIQYVCAPIGQIYHIGTKYIYVYDYTFCIYEHTVLELTNTHMYVKPL